MATIRIEVFRDRRGHWRWRQRASNGKITETAEAYASKRNALRAAQRRRDTMSAASDVVVCK